MVVSVKNKIWLGTLFLFFLLLLTGGTGIYYMAKLKSEGKDVLKANYESLEYCQAMQKQLIEFEEGNSGALSFFSKFLMRQENNITEPGEDKATSDLRKHFNSLQSGDSSRHNLHLLEASLQSVLNLNMHAIKNKSQLAEKTAQSALTIISALSALVFLIALTFIVNFPSIITNPITRLTEGIKEIADKNYKHRIHIESEDEYGKLADAFNEMAQRLQFFESSNLNKLLFEKSRAEAVINSLKDASIGIDNSKRILFANHHALQLLGVQSSEIVGKSTEEVMRTNDLLRFLMENEAATPFKIIVEGRENYFVKEVIDVAQGETNNKVIVLRNITSFKELDVAKTNFISTISHELKTPLASSDFGLRLLGDERVSKLTPEQKDLILKLKEDNKRMLKILSELLNLSQVEAGRIQVNASKVNPADIITQAIQAVSLSAQEKDIKLVDTSTADLPALLADIDKSTWVLNNFLTNAIKYSYNNSTIEVKAEKKKDQLVFSVTDHGPGIDQIYLPRLFERYFQVPGSKEKGTGLGLAISKEFVEAQHGNIWVTSEVGKGTSFYFSLPL